MCSRNTTERNLHFEMNILSSQVLVMNFMACENESSCGRHLLQLQRPQADCSFRFKRHYLFQLPISV